MNRILLAALALTALPLTAPADEPAVRLTVRPMAAPKPALKYQLLPEQSELNPGNPAQNYLKCFMEQRNFFFGKEAVAERANYLAMPLAELPADQLRDYGGNALRQADWAARLDALDWQVGQRLQADGLDVELPEASQLWLLAPALRVRFRGAVAGRRFDDAVRSAKTMFALARHLGAYPAEEADWVGLSVADQAVDTLEEMVQQPSCPNLYWALTDLPCPLVDVRQGLRGGCARVAAELRPLREDAPMTDAELEKAVRRLSGVTAFLRERAGDPPRNVRAALAARAADAEQVRAARARLVEAGCKEAVVGKFPPVQVILLGAKRAYEVRRDERLKLLTLAPWQIDALAGGEETADDGLLAEFLPDAIGLRRAQGRLEQRLGLLRHVEALRLYAAAHDGQLPAALADVAVPLPDDPFTGKPFGYDVKGTSARVGRYEVSIQK